MNWKRALGLVGVGFIPVLPSYTVERITDYYFLTSNPLFGVWSSERTWLFIVSILAGALLAGSLFRTLSLDLVVSYLAGIAVLLSLLYYFCQPNVCYSFGIDGAEPLRVAFFFSSLAIVGISVGCYARDRQVELSGRSLLVVAGATVGAIAYYPVIFTVAGARLLSPLSPLPLLAMMALLSFGAAAKVARTRGVRDGAAVAMLSDALVVIVSVGIARQYLFEILPVVASILVVGALSASLGAWVSGRPSHDAPSRRADRSNATILAALLLALLMMPVFMPDATAGVIPQEADGHSPPSYQFGTAAYAGAFMTQSFLRLKGVSVDVSFAGTNASSIQADNFLSAGIGIHSPHCCIDGIDFGYRFDVYLFHDGSEMLAAEAWEVCDWVMACGGHSWQDLLFFTDEKISPGVSSGLRLFLEWEDDRTVVWSYSVAGGVVQNFTSFVPPPQDNAYFNVGTLGGIPSAPQAPSDFFPDATLAAVLSSSSQTPGYYFFQYGLMSAYPIGHAGWRVTLSCPAYLMEADDWTCVQHSDSIQGDKAYWKVLWRWGEPYSNVAATPNDTAGSPSVTFSYSSSSTMPSFEPLW